MHILNLPLLLAPLALSISLPPQAQSPFLSSLQPQTIFANSKGFRIPTSRESAILARRILHLTPLGTLSTIFPSSSPHQASATPEDLAHTPIGLMDYISDCAGPDYPGDPALLAIDIATTFRNARAGSNVSLAINWLPPPPSPTSSSFLSALTSFFSKPSKNEQSPYPHSAASLPRFSLSGYLAPISASPELEECFLAQHPDAKYWLPGNRIHESEWMRLVVTHVYWIGGFGDRAFIGWIPLSEWRGVEEGEWRAVRLPGETDGEGRKAGLDGL